MRLDWPNKRDSILTLLEQNFSQLNSVVGLSMTCIDRKFTLSIDYNKQDCPSHQLQKLFPNHNVCAKYEQKEVNMPRKFIVERKNKKIAGMDIEQMLQVLEIDYSVPSEQNTNNSFFKFELDYLDNFDDRLPIDWINLGKKPILVEMSEDVWCDDIEMDQKMKILNIQNKKKEEEEIKDCNIELKNMIKKTQLEMKNQQKQKIMKKQLHIQKNIMNIQREQF
ncbi:MAG: hypothetical protein EZS28_011618 [Streblomastix strix]|uniref:Uncharacterized protein n=1 Tax=Streblomastix strix TaxID=222440 RepID=A0A5J4WDV7_9EUKA|nr:MAG: hypothetical protein EZS28_011618 [Streblomastix strix]